MWQGTLNHLSTTHSTIALSSCKAALGGFVNGTSLGPGFKIMASDLGLIPNIIVHCDAHAAVGIPRRRGLCKIRHGSVADLWGPRNVEELHVRSAQDSRDSKPRRCVGQTEKLYVCELLSSMKADTEDGRASSAP